MSELVSFVLPEEKLTAIAAMYGIRVAALGAAEGGYRNVSHSFTGVDDRAYNFILYKNESGIVELIRRTNALGAYIRRTGLPVRAPVDERILRVGKRYGSLYSYLDGVTIPWEAYTMKHIKLLGYAMARFHAAASSYDGPVLPDVEDVYEEIVGRIERYFASSDVRRALSDKLGFSVSPPDAISLLRSAKKLAGRTPLHMDFVRSNVLFREVSANDPLTVGSVALSGILDLEKAAVGHPLFDVARTFAFLLVDCPKPAGKIRNYFINSGYRKRGECELSTVRICGDDMLEQLVTLFLTYDLYKFLKQNPYESLLKNHHFKRTVDILRARKVIQYE